MKQLVNKYDSRVRLTVPEADTEETYIYFFMPTDIGPQRCIWNSRDWRLEEWKGEDDGEDPALLDWIREIIKKRGYTATGVSRSCGFSHAWLNQILRGKRKLRDKSTFILDEALGLKKGTVARKKKETLHKG